MTSQHSFHNTGITLVEIVVVVAIVSVIGIMIAKFQSDVFSFNRQFSSSLTTSNSAQKLLRPMTAEIRSASASGTGAFPIDSISPYDFAFYSDIDNDGLKEWIRYYILGTTMYKEVIKPSGSPAIYASSSKITTTFVTNVRNSVDVIPVFQYYSSGYKGGPVGEVIPGTGNIDTVRLVKVTLKVDDDINKPPAAMTIMSQVLIRNLKQ